MRSWSILFPNLDDLKAFLGGNGTPSVPPLDPWFEPPFTGPESEELRRLFVERLQPRRLDRVYFGVEFCHRLLPDPDPLREAFRMVREAGLSFSFITPPVTDSGIEAVTSRVALLRDAAGDVSDLEVIVNDWGVLHRMRERFPEIEPVFGRMMNKMIRDPRVTPYYASRNAPKEGLRAVRESSLSNPVYPRILGKWGVKRFEYDNVHQGIALEGADFEVSVYVPYGYVATGRMCMPGSLHLPKEDKFTEYIGCRKECQEFTHELSSELPATRVTMNLIQRGNTIFYPNSRWTLEAVLSDGASAPVDRIVYQPGLPI